MGMREARGETINLMYKDLILLRNKALYLYFNTESGQRCLCLGVEYKADIQLIDGIDEVYVYKENVYFISSGINIIKFWEKLSSLESEEIIKISESTLFSIYLNINNDYKEFSNQSNHVESAKSQIKLESLKSGLVLLEKNAKHIQETYKNICEIYCN